MKAIILKDKNLVELGELNEPVLEENKVKIAVSYCGLCGSDLHKVDGRKTVRPLVYPVALGHEISGVVEDVGSKVTDFKKGDRVTVDPNWACGNCFYCNSGVPHLCENSKGVVKGMADYVCCPEENVYHIPDNLSLVDAALAEPLSCCIHGIDLLDVHENNTVAIVGMGAIGTIMLQLIKLKGVKNIIVIDVDESKKDKAFKLGANEFLNPTAENFMDAINNKYIDRVIECVGSIHTFKTCVDVACKGATIVIFGLAKPDDTAAFNIYELSLKELTIKGAIVNLNCMARAIDLLSNKKINIEETISRVISPEEMVQEIYNRNLIKNGKVIVEWKKG